MSQVWLITGSSAAWAMRLPKLRLPQDTNSSLPRNPAQLAGLVECYGDQVRAVALDVTDPQAAKDAINTAVEAFGRLDVLVNNAGYGDIGSIEDTSLEDFRAQIETNLFGVINVTKAALPLLRQQGTGHIIQVSSIGGRRSSPGFAPYQAAKWGVEGFSEALAKEVRPLGIKVTILEPGGFRTDWSGASMTIHTSRPEYDSTVGAVARFQREYDGTQPGDPRKAAAVILQVASLEEPPLRLLLGSDAVRLAEQNDETRREADQKWRDLSVSTDFETGDSSKNYPWKEK